MLLPVFFSCSKEEEVRQPENIMGIWSPDDSTYLEFTTNNSVYHLTIEQQDGESIGLWVRDVYYYEPGYDLVIYLTAGHDADVYQIVEMTADRLTWCWVKNIDITDMGSTDAVGHLIGEIINEAQEGFKLNPELYQNFTRISEDRFFSIIESLDIDYPW